MHEHFSIVTRASKLSSNIYFVGAFTSVKKFIDTAVNVAKRDAYFIYEKVLNTDIQAKMEEAKKAMDKIDPKDTPFIAAALSMQFDVWSSLLTPFCCSISNFKINRRPLCNPNIAVLLSPLTYILAL